VAGQFMVARMKDKANGTASRPTWNTFGFSLAFSATFN
jgi:hypothetical protein